MFYKIAVLENFAKLIGKKPVSEEHMPTACNFMKNETPVQVFSCDSWKRLRITFLCRPPSDDCFSFFNIKCSDFEENLFFPNNTLAK